MSMKRARRAAAVLAAASATDVLAVGGYNPGKPPTAVLTNPYAEHWNGSTWRQVKVPDIGPLDAVTAAPGRVWVAGGNEAGGAEVDQFNGTTWTKLPAVPNPYDPLITGLADTAAGLWAVGYFDFGCGEGTCTAPWAGLWNGTTWTQAPAGGGTNLSGVVAVGSQVLAASTNPVQVLRLTPTRATPQVAPQFNGALNALTADPAGHLWSVGWTYGAHDKFIPAIITAPGIGQGGITVTTGAGEATVTWVGPVTGAGETDMSGDFATGGLPDGRYTITASLPGCHPGVATAQVTAGLATAVKAHITCCPVLCHQRPGRVVSGRGRLDRGVLADG